MTTVQHTNPDGSIVEISIRRSWGNPPPKISIGEFTTIGSNLVISGGEFIIQDHVTIGDNVRLYGHVLEVQSRVNIGNGTSIGAHEESGPITVIGAWSKIRDDVMISQATIGNNTTIGKRSCLGHFITIGNRCDIGEDTTIINGVVLPKDWYVPAHSVVNPYEPPVIVPKRW